MEAAIDFSDEELPEGMIEKQSADLRLLRDEILRHLNDNHRGERLREGFSIAILGAPNAGKSSLLNTLAQREAAIVSPFAGTTRDVIEVHLDIGGYPVILADTAGLRTSLDAVESEGVRRAHLRAVEADLKLVVLDGTVSALDELVRGMIDADTIIVVNKADLIEERRILDSGFGIQVEGFCPRILISALSGEGIDALLQRMTQEINLRFGGSGAPPLTRARHRTALEECTGHLDRAMHASQPDLRAEDVRLAMRALGRITGHVDVEDLLDIIFRDFCIGK
jgi:tRNA modification GTPase